MMIEILSQILKALPFFFVFFHTIAAIRAKDDIKEIKHILWTLLFIVVGIADAII